jgi:hypothetical protein
VVNGVQCHGSVGSKGEHRLSHKDRWKGDVPQRPSAPIPFGLDRGFAWSRFTVRLTRRWLARGNLCPR